MLPFQSFFCPAQSMELALLPKWLARSTCKHFFFSAEAAQCHSAAFTFAYFFVLCSLSSKAPISFYFPSQAESSKFRHALAQWVALLGKLISSQGQRAALYQSPLLIISSHCFTSLAAAGFLRTKLSRALTASSHLSRSSEPVRTEGKQKAGKILTEWFCPGICPNYMP